jgi:hypothetical protein
VRQVICIANTEEHACERPCRAQRQHRYPVDAVGCSQRSPRQRQSATPCQLLPQVDLHRGRRCPRAQQQRNQAHEVQEAEETAEVLTQSLLALFRGRDTHTRVGQRRSPWRGFIIQRGDGVRGHGKEDAVLDEAAELQQAGGLHRRSRM